MITLRDGFDLISPPWLSRRVAKRVQWAIGLVLDGFRDFVNEGIKLRMPGVGNPEALPFIGNDRQIDRGPRELDDQYGRRLSAAFDTWRTMGNPRPLLEQLRVYFLPDTPAIRVVSDSGVWHEIDAAGVITRTKTAPSNWNWDAFAGTRWWRGWVIIDSSAGPWTSWTWDSGPTWDDGHTWDSTATLEEVFALQRIVRKCKPAHVDCLNIILLFDPTILRVSDTSPPNPDGDWDVDTNRDLRAVYLPGPEM